MVKGIYAYHDALNGYVNVFLETSDAVATRGFKSALDYAQEGSLFYSCPEDYSLWKLGNFDLKSGEIIPDTPTLLVRGERKNV